MGLPFPSSLPGTAAPSLADFTAWVYAFMGVPTAALPLDSPWLPYALDVAVATVNQQLMSVPGPIYTLAVYCFAGDWLVNWAADVPGVVAQGNNPNGLGYFGLLRSQLNLTGFLVGPVASSADESTSSSYVVPEFYKEFTLQQMSQLGTPWGRRYLELAQKVGANWGLS